MRSVPPHPHEVFGGLTDLPVTVGERTFDRLVDLGALERRERQHGPAPDGRLIAAAGQDGRYAPFVADGPQGSDRGLAHQGDIGPGGELDESADDLVRHVFVLAARPRGMLEDHRVGVVQHTHEVVAGSQGCELDGSSTHAGLAVGERHHEVVVGEAAATRRGTQRQLSCGRVGVAQRRPSSRGVTPVTGLDHGAPTIGLRVAGHDFNIWVSVKTEYATANEISVASTAPMTTASALPAHSAHSFRQMGVRRCMRVGISARATGCGAREVRRSRANGAVALAGLRHPAAIIAMIARPAIQAEAVVTSEIDTQPEIVPTGGAPVASPRPAHRMWAVPLAVVGLLTLFVVIAASVLPGSLVAENAKAETASYARVPAEAQPVADRLSFDAVERYPADGTLLFVTVREPKVTVLDWFVGSQQPEVGFLSTKDKFGVQTPEQQRRINVQMMRSAKETAEYVALETLGFPVDIVPGDVIVSEMLCLEPNQATQQCDEWAPSDELLDPGDKLLAVDGQPLTTIDDLAAVLKGHEPGDEVTVDFDRPGVGEQSGTIELIASNDGTDRTIIGFVPFDTATAKLPFDVSIDSGAIGGPSAGLAFTLTLIDELTPGELTGDNLVAVTGTIRIDGTVGAIGGLVQKTSAVRQMGAKVFLVPFEQGEDNIAEARAVAGDDLRIVPVKDVDEALAALADVGGNGLELGKPGADFEPAASGS